MEDIVYEIVGGAIILGIIILVISVFRNSAGTIKEEVNLQSQLEDVTVIDTIGIDNGEYNSSKIQEAFNYSQVSDVAIEVYVKPNGGNYDKVDTSSDALALANDRSKRYKLHILYLKEKTTTKDIPSTSNLLTNRNGGNVAVVRFAFEEIH